MCSISLEGDISATQLLSSPFPEIVSEIRGPSEEHDVPEKRPALEKISFEGKRDRISVGGPISLPFRLQYDQGRCVLAEEVVLSSAQLIHSLSINAW